VSYIVPVTNPGISETVNQTYQEKAVSYGVVLLNMNLQPLNVITTQKALKMLFTGKAETVRSAKQTIRYADKTVRKPLILKMKYMIDVAYKYVKRVWSRHFVFERDGYCCAYCRRDGMLTIDHVIPRSRGGKQVMTNTVACCPACNIRKMNKTPEEAGMTLQTKPYDLFDIVFDMLKEPDSTYMLVTCF